MDYTSNQEACQDVGPERQRPGYYAIIPADVRYDDRIPANAKLLYGEISALIGPEGFCFAGNQYFADAYGWSPVTVARLIGKLEEAGYISRELVRDGSGQVDCRKMWLNVSSCGEHPLNNFDNTSPQNCGEGGIKNVKDTNTSISNNIKKKNIKKKKENEESAAPSPADFDPMPLFEDWIRRSFPEQPAQVKNGLYLAASRFAKNREALKKPYKTAQAVTASCNKLVKLSGGKPLEMIALLDNATEHNWQGIFPLNREAEAAPKEERQYKCV